MISVLILTRNEAQDLPAALASVAFSDDIHILDSQSTDATAAIARQAGAQVHTRAFDNYAAQRNFGLELPFAHPWLLILDADERPTPKLATELLQISALPPPPRSPPSASAAETSSSIPGSSMPRSAPTTSASSVPAASVIPARSTRSSKWKAPSSISNIRSITFPFPRASPTGSPSITSTAPWKPNSSTRNPACRTPPSAPPCAIPTSTPAASTRKPSSINLPGRPLIKWCYMMFVRGAILDGAAGITYATLQSIYEYLIVLKTRELRLTAPALISNKVRYKFYKAGQARLSRATPHTK